MPHWMLEIKNPKNKIICPQLSGKAAVLEFEQCSQRYQESETVDNGCRECKIFLQECVDRAARGDKI